MSSLISVQTLIEYIEAMPAQEQTLLFDELFRRNIIKQRQENIDSTVKVAVDSAIWPVIEKLGQENTEDRVNMVKFLDAIRKAGPLIMAEREKSRQENTKETVKTQTLLTGNE